MLPHTRSVAPLTAMLAILVLATDAQAQDGKMYSASLILHAFANDTTSGSTPPYEAYTLQALPLGAYCNPGNGGKTCEKLTLHEGAPLTGSGTTKIISTQPTGFILPAHDFERETSGSLPPFSGVSYTATYADLWNAKGSFFAGGGPGSFSFVPVFGSGMTRAVVVAGKKQFGGRLRLMGNFGTHAAGKTMGGGAWHGIFPDWGLGVVGDSYGKADLISGSFIFTSPPLAYKSIALVTGFPWTTGRVSVSAAAGSGFPTHLVRSGYDNRTPGGGGTIQMVTPRLTHWAAGAHWGDIAVLRIQFAPEPEGWVLLAAGLSLIAVLHHSGAGRSRRGQKSREH